MKKNEKIFVGVLIVILIIVIMIARGRKSNQGQADVELPVENEVKEEFVEVLEDGTRLNKSEVLNQDRKLGNLSFTNIQLTNANGQSILLADVTNTGTTATEMQLVDIIILDKNGNELGTVGGVIIPLQPGQSTQFNSGTQNDYANAYDFKIVEATE